jgi:hypothetical protein
MRRKRLAVKILVYFTFVTCLGGAVFLLGYRIRHPQPNQAYARSHESPTPQGAETNQENDAEVNRQATENHDNYAAKWTEPIAVLTILLLAVASIAAYVYYGQLKEMRKTVAAVGGQGETMKGQLSEMRRTLDAIERQEIVFKDQARIYDQQREIMERQADYFEDTERAYVGIRRMFPKGLDGEDALGVQITFRNGGRSPAFDFKAYAVVKAGDTPQPFAWVEAAPPMNRIFIPAGEDRNLVVTHFEFAEAKDITEEGKLLFVDGEARYSTLGGKQRILCFGATYRHPGPFEVRYHYEREAEGKAEAN